MFFDQDIIGNRLPPGTICLTYDDGPGPETLELGRYLAEQHIPATFFVIGQHAEKRPDVLRDLQAQGHLIGNHTYSHPGLVALALSGGNVIEELVRTDRVIRPYVTGDVTFFRAPYGNWRETSNGDRETSIVADALNRCSQLANYLGPVNWDISAADYDFWKRGAPADDCACAYLSKIDRVGRGIVLMHDSSEDPAVARNNQILAVARRIVPVLKANGYRFVRLDAVPQAREAMAALHLTSPVTAETESGVP